MVLKQCTICNRKFTKTEHFKRHQRSHTRERPYECSTCEKRFSRSDVLFRHVKSHTRKAAEAEANLQQAQDDEALRSLQRGQSDLSASGTELSHLSQDRGAAVEMDGSNMSGYRDANIPSLRHLSLSSIPGAPLYQPTPLAGNERPDTFPPIRDAFAEPGLSPTQQREYPAPQNWTSNISPEQAAAARDRQQSITQLPSLETVTSVVTDTSSYSDGRHLSNYDSSAMMGGQHDALGDLLGTPMGLEFDGQLTGLLQSWLMTPSAYSISTGHLQPPVEHPAAPHADPTGRHASTDMSVHSSLDGALLADKIPYERFSRVEECWLTPSRKTHRLLPTLWRDVVNHPARNLFSDPYLSDATSNSPRKEGTRWGIDDSLRQTLESKFGRHSTNGFSPYSHDLRMQTPSKAFPPTEIFDIAIDLYFRNFHPLAPFFHIPTFSAKSTPITLLFVMSLVGLSMIPGAIDFVSQSFPTVLEKVSTEISGGICTARSPSTELSTFAAALLLLNLAAITGDKEKISQSQMLYASLLAMAQQHGLFAANDEGTQPEDILRGIQDTSAQWEAWARVESVKRLVISLLGIDSWYASYLSVTPLVRSETLRLIPPCDDTLFKATTANRWMHYGQSGRHFHMPLITPFSLDEQYLQPTLRLEPFTMYSILSTLQLSLCDAQQRLLNNPIFMDTQRQTIPWRVYSADLRAQTLVSRVLALMHTSDSDLNTMVLWHTLCMTLCANTHIFELAAGRNGFHPAGKALDDIAAWSSTPTARRACLHAGQIYRLLSNRKVSDAIMLHSVTALFYAALVLSLYIFRGPPQAAGNHDQEYFELLDEVSWANVGDAGLVDDQPTSSTMYEPRQNDLARDFIRNGGIVSLSGVPHFTGYEFARRILLDFGNLMDGMGKWKLKTFSRVLRIMSDVLE